MPPTTTMRDMTTLSRYALRLSSAGPVAPAAGPLASGGPMLRTILFDWCCPRRALRFGDVLGYHDTLSRP
jgi:hypothetical protein